MRPVSVRIVPSFTILALAVPLGLLSPGCGGGSGDAPAREAAGPPGLDGARGAARAIVRAARSDHRSWRRLAELCDGVGARPAGSEALDRAIAWAAAAMRDDGLDEVRTDPVQVGVWERGEESAWLLEPGPARPLALLGLGGSVGTRGEGLEAEVVVVPHFDALDELGEAVRGRIVLYNFPMVERENMFRSYGEAVAYRVQGANRASAHGAAAVLVRSVTTRSLRTPHTGAMMPYADDVTPIPAAAVSVEDAEMLQRLADRGDRPVVRLTMGARTLPPAPSANVIGELRGRERPDEIVVVGGHLDSWDVGQGAHDDGAGCVMAMEAARLLRELDLRPRRTVRVVLYTNEECGLDGARAYAERYGGDLQRHVAAMESDAGGFRPLGFTLDGDERDLERLEPLMRLFSPLGRLTIRRGGSGADISRIVRRGVPGLGFRPESTHYFDYHHSEADTVDKVDPDELADSVAAFTLMTWILAEMDEPLRRRPAEPAG